MRDLRSLPRFLFPNCFKTDFTVHNLPYGMFSSKKDLRRKEPRIGVAVGDKILDLRVLSDHNLLPNVVNHNLQTFMGAGIEKWKEVRECLQNLVSDSHPNSLKNKKDVLNEAIIAQDECVMHMPCTIGDYTDFYASKEHASNVGMMFRDVNNPLLPNWLHIPVGYHGRASSVVISHTEIVRPCGQVVEKDQNTPKFLPTQCLDLELEMAFFVGTGNELGSSIPLKEAENKIFGMTLMNDWSARDIQKWEYVPLGPFLGKSFGTTISPWIVPMQALEPFKTKLPQTQDPKPLPYLRHEEDDLPAYDIKLEAEMNTGKHSQIITKTNLKYMYWSIAQQLTHHSSNGCNMRPGDLLGTGTISGPTKDSFGSLLELTWAGKHPLKIGDETRTYIQDGDTITIHGYCENEEMRIGFGACVGKIVPSRK